MEHPGGLCTLTCVDHEERPVAVTIGTDRSGRTVCVWDLNTGNQITTARAIKLVDDNAATFDDRYLPVACMRLDDRDVVMTATGPIVRVWDLKTGAKAGRPLRGHEKDIHAIACIYVDGHATAVTGGLDNKVHVWDMHRRRSIRSVTTDRGITGITCADLNGRPVAIWCDDASIHVWDLRAGRRVGKALTAPGIMLRRVTHAYLGGRLVAITAGYYAAVHVWDIEAGELLGRPLYGDSVSCVMSGHVDGYPVAVTGGYDKTVRVWTLSDTDVDEHVQAGHSRAVRAVVSTLVHNRPVAISAGADGALRQWDLIDGTPASHATRAHIGRVRAVACTELDGRTVAVTGGEDKTSRVWDRRPASRPDLCWITRIGYALSHAPRCAASPSVCWVSERPTALSIYGPVLIGRALTGHSSWVTALSCVESADRPVVVSVGDDATVRLWDLTTFEPIDMPLTGHSAMINSVTCMVFDGRPVAVTGSTDETIRLWDLYRRRRTADRLVATQQGAVYAVAGTTVARVPAILAAGSEKVIHTYPLNKGFTPDSFDLPYEVRALASVEGRGFIVGFGSEVAYFQPRWNGSVESQRPYGARRPRNWKQSAWPVPQGASTRIASWWAAALAMRAPARPGPRTADVTLAHPQGHHWGRLLGCTPGRRCRTETALPDRPKATVSMYSRPSTAHQIVATIGTGRGQRVLRHPHLQAVGDVIHGRSAAIW